MKAVKVIRGIFLTLFFIIIAFILFRIFFMEDESTLKTVYPTESAVKAYSEYGKDAFKYHKVTTDIASDGYYNAYAFVYIPSEKELQITTKYNDSLPTEYMEGANEADFYWELRDENGDTVSRGEVVDKTEKYYYNYSRVVFKNVEIGDDTQLYLQLCDDAIGYPTEKTKYDNFNLFVYENKLKPYKLSKEEIDLLTK